tara:strand:+ start:390 stop:638 length:249 start_codon:yes stop_codon:yes gene_type:complete
LGSGSPAVLLSSVDVSEVSHSSGTGGVSSESLGRPVISSLLGVETTSTLSILSLLEMEVGSSGVSRKSMGMSMLQTSCWGSS